MHIRHRIKSFLRVSLFWCFSEMQSLVLFHCCHAWPQVWPSLHCLMYNICLDLNQSAPVSRRVSWTECRLAIFCSPDWRVLSQKADTLLQSADGLLWAMLLHHKQWIVFFSFSTSLAPPPPPVHMEIVPVRTKRKRGKSQLTRLWKKYFMLAILYVYRPVHYEIWAWCKSSWHFQIFFFFSLILSPCLSSSHCITGWCWMDRILVHSWRLCVWSCYGKVSTNMLYCGGKKQSNSVIQVLYLTTLDMLYISWESPVRSAVER